MKSNENAHNCVRLIYFANLWMIKWMNRESGLNYQNPEEAERERTNGTGQLATNGESNGNSVEMPIYFKFLLLFVCIEIVIDMHRFATKTLCCVCALIFRSYWMKFVGKIMVPWEGAFLARSRQRQQQKSICVVCSLRTTFCVHHRIMSLQVAPASRVREAGREDAYTQFICCPA